MAAGLSPNCHRPTPWRCHTPPVLKKLPGAARNPSGGLLLAVIYDHSHRFVKNRPAACNFKNPPIGSNILQGLTPGELYLLSSLIFVSTKAIHGAHGREVQSRPCNRKILSSIHQSGCQCWDCSLAHARILSNFYFSHSVFIRCLLQTCKNEGLFWERVNGCHVAWTGTNRKCILYVGSLLQ